MPDPEFKPLPLSSLTASTGYQHPYYFSVNPVRAGSSALEAMTDLKFMPAATVSELLPVGEARQLMIARGVRLLLVVDEVQSVSGLVSARDLEGPRFEAAAAAGGVTAQILVSTVMTPADAVEVLKYDDVLHARVGDIVETLKGSGRQHALVVDHELMSGTVKVRGIFSASQIARQMGIPTSGSFDLEATFGELERQLRASS